MEPVFASSQDRQIVADVPDPDRLSDRELLDACRSLERTRRRLDAAYTTLIGEIDQRGAFGEDRATSMVGWLVAKGTSRTVAASTVRIARTLREMPAVSDAFGSGELDSYRVRLLCEAHDTAPEVFDRDEQVLVDTTSSLTASDAKKAVAYWTQAAAPEGAAEQEKAANEARRLFVSPTYGLVTDIDGQLGPLGGETVIQALNAHMEPTLLDTSDRRSIPQRRADALVDICRHYLDTAGIPIAGGDRPHITLLVSEEALAGGPGSPCELAEIGVTTPRTAQLLSCDATVDRITIDPHGTVLDVGRRTRTIPASIRRALDLRDGGCAIAGCERPERWCDAHHITHWAAGGTTALWNLVLLCRWHHTQVHNGDITLPRRE